ncbi:MAG: 50S ribosomal protein L25 [Treponemataceae bacterium]|nr:50S ribosomal protein L25 [Treponemataceae bacterium]
MDKLVINAATRKTTGKKAARSMRAAGQIPAVIYNSKGESTMLEVNAVEFNKVWRAITPTTTIELKIDGGEGRTALIKDTEYNIRTDQVLHADFFEPAEDKKITAVMKVQYTGTPAGVLKGGFMLKHLPVVKIQAVAAHLPERIVADVSALNIGDSFKVKDLQLSDGIDVLSDGEAALASVSPAR